MKVSTLIERLQLIQKKFGDVSVTGGAMVDDHPLRNVCVTDTEGREIWPGNPNGLKGPHKIDGVFFE